MAHPLAISPALRCIGIMDTLRGRVRLAFACLGLLGAVAAFGAPVETLRDAYIQWRGGEAFRAMHRRHIRGDIRVSTLSGTFEAWEDSNGRYRFDVHAGAVDVSTRVDGTVGYSVTPGGQVESLSPQECERRIGSVLTGYATVLEGGAGAKLSPLPPTAKGGEREGFRVTLPNGDTFDFQMRPDGELLRAREVVDGIETITTFSDWQMVDGVRLPHTTESITTSDGQRTVLRVTEDRVNPEFDPALFAKPEPKSRLAFRPGAHDSGTIPIELLAERRLFFAGAVGGKPATLLLDSGAEVTVIDAAFARSIGLQPTGRMDVRGTGGTENLPMASDVTVALGTMTLRTGMVLLMDLGQMATLMDHPVQVVLGKEVLNQTVTDVDFEARTIRFHDPAGFRPPAGMTRVPLTVAAGIRTVPVTIEDRGTVSADFDLGNGGPLLLYPQVVAKWDLLGDRRVAHRLGGGVGGLHPENLIVVKRIEIGGHVLKDVPATAPEGAGAMIATDSVQGNVGMPVWSRFHLVMDFGRNQLFVSATPASLARPFAKNRSGVVAIRDGGALKVLFVDPVFPGRVCERGAEIVAIDGVPVTKIRSVTEWAERPAGTVVTLTFRDGHKAELTLSDYY